VVLTSDADGQSISAATVLRQWQLMGLLKRIPESVTPTPKNARPLGFHYPLAQFL
jgi:hypothetical protein